MSPRRTNLNDALPECHKVYTFAATVMITQNREMQKRLLYIINPVAGTERKDPVRTAIKENTDNEQYAWKIAETRYSGHGAVLATMAVENDVDVVVAIGGDGTVNEIARSLTQSRTTLGIIPCGSGNGLARHLQIPLEPKKAVELINRGTVAAVDYGIINRHPFFCTCGVGFDATISYMFSSSIRRGVASYLEKVLKEITRYRPETYIISSGNNEIACRAFLLTCANASQYGNNAYIAPSASMSDGLMDVTVIEPFTAFEAPQLAYKLLDGTLTPGGRVRMFRSDRLHILREREGVIHCDGDPVKAGKEIDVHIVPKGLRIIVNEAARNKRFSLLNTIEEAFSSFIERSGLAIQDGTDNRQSGAKG